MLPCHTAATASAMITYCNCVKMYSTGPVRPYPKQSPRGHAHSVQNTANLQNSIVQSHFMKSGAFAITVFFHSSKHIVVEPQITTVSPVCPRYHVITFTPFTPYQTPKTIYLFIYMLEACKRQCNRLPEVADGRVMSFGVMIIIMTKLWFIYTFYRLSLVIKIVHWMLKIMTCLNVFS